jgi:hypothetical protein
MKNSALKTTLLAMILILSSLIIAPVYAWQEVDTMNMCNQPLQVVRVYQGNAASWGNRDHYTATKKHQIYARNCPQVRAPKKLFQKKTAYRKVKRTQQRSKTCRACYKKGYKAGYRAAHKKLHYRKVQRKKGRRITRSARRHAAEVADCKRVDQANHASRTKVIASW